MPRLIAKIREFYLEWSTITDTPVTFGMSLETFKAYYRHEYGRDGYNYLQARLVRVEKNGTSSQVGLTVHDLVPGNRAGPGESELTLGEIYQAYCLREPIRDGWLVPVYEGEE